jgi:ABC-type antimicrobial peptide transport system permease subunit
MRKKRTILILLLTVLVIVMLSLAAYFFNLLNYVVHGDLYSFGLLSDTGWLDNYWLYSKLIFYSIISSAAVTIVSTFLAILHIQTRKSHPNLTRATLFLGVLLTGISFFFFSLINGIVNSDLYTFGLQFSFDWFGQYLSYLFWSLAILVFAMVIQGATLAYYVFGPFFASAVSKPKKKRSSKTVWVTLAAIAVRNIPRRKLRNSLTILAIILGVTLMVGVNIAFDSVYDQFKHTVNEAVGNVDINVKSSLDLPFNQTLLDTVKEIDGVYDAYARLSSNVNVSRNNNLTSAVVVGISSTSDFDYLDSATTNITGTKNLTWNGTEAIVDSRLNYTIGETITLNVTLNSDPTLALYLNKTRKSSEYNFTVVGIYHPNPLVLEASGQFGEGYVDYTIYIDVNKAQNILEYKNEVNLVSATLADVKETDRVVDELNSKLGSDYIVIPIKKSILNIMESATVGLKSGLEIMSVMALCVAIVIVLNTMYMNVGERVYEIGILRSQGTSTGQIFWIFFSESLILGVIGVILGLITGMLSTEVFRYLTSRVFQPISGSFSFSFSFSSIPTQHLIVGASTGMLTVVIGGLFPSLKACKTNIINALRPSMRKPGKQRTALKLVALGLPLTIIGSFMFLWFDYFSQFGLGLVVTSAIAPIPMIGVTLLAAGLLRSAGPLIERLLILFGKPRKIISRNIERNLLRSTICFALIGMSLNLVILMGGAQTGTVMGVENVVRSFSSSDVTVSSRELISKSFASNLTNGNVGLVDVAAPVLAVPERVTLQNNSSEPVVNSSSTIIAIEPDSYPKAMSMTFSEDSPSDVFTRLNSSGTIVLTSPLAKSLNVSLGENVEMQIFSLDLVEVLVPISTPAPSYPPQGEDSIPDSPSLDDGSLIDPSLIPDSSSADSNFNEPTVPLYTVTYVPQVNITSMNFTIVGLAQGAWLELMTVGGAPLSEAGYISYNSLNETFPKYYNNSNMFFLKVNSGQDVNLIKERILNLYGNEYEISATTYNDAVERVRNSIDEIFYILYSVVMFAVVNSAIGVAAIMIMNVTERRREIGIFRSQGMSRTQVVVSIFGEAACLGFIGFLVGTAVGLIFHRITVSYMRVAGFPMPYLIPYDAIWISFVLAIVTSITSAVYAANRASKLNIVEALRS